MNLDEMPAGREMDALIMEKVFNSIRYITTDDGLEVGLVDNSIAMHEWEKPVENKYRFEEDGTPRWEQGNGKRWFTQKIPHYSTDIADAWKVVENIRSIPRYYLGEEYGAFIADTINIYQCCSNNWCCLIGTTPHDDDPTFESVADSAPLAICRAALKALGVEE